MWQMFPLPHGQAVAIEPRTAGAVRDGFAQPDAFGAAVTVEGCAVSPGAPAQLPTEQNRPLPEDVECTVYAPPGTTARKGDRATVPGFGPLKVLARAAGWGMNPFTGEPSGVVILCGRFDG